MNAALRVALVSTLALTTLFAGEAFAQQSPAEAQAATLLQRFESEPDVNRVQAAALSYANLHPEIFNDMRFRARAAGAVPEVRFRVTKDFGEKTEQVVFVEDGETTSQDDLELQGELKWKLGDTVFNTRETAVVRENRYAAKERVRLLQQVNQTYFERRRAQLDLVRSPPNDPASRALAELKIAQLTSELDALTGGAFSRMVRGGK